MIETLQSVKAIAYARQTAATFGHLAPKPKKYYKGYIVFTLTAFGDTCIIDFDFKDLEASPWFNIDVLDYITNYTDKVKKDFAVIKWHGNYKKYKNGKANFKGIFKEVDLML